jgi:hypothetical protein
VHKGSTQTNKKIEDRVQIQKSKKPSVPWSRAPDSFRCTRTVQSQTSHSRVFASALRYNSPDCPVHWRSNGYPTQRSTATDTLQRYSVQTVRTEVRAVVRGAPDSEQCLAGAAPDCPVPLEDKASNGQKLPNPNGWVTWLAHRTVSGGALDCPVRPSIAATPNGCLVVEGYKYPQPPPLQASKFPALHIQYKS